MDFLFIVCLNECLKYEMLMKFVEKTKSIEK